MKNAWAKDAKLELRYQLDEDRKERKLISALLSEMKRLTLLT